MPNKSSPPKHETPNYRQVRHEHPYIGVFGQERVQVTYTWEPMPLRADRKDVR
jgi:hypothetical protein